MSLENPLKLFGLNNLAIESAIRSIQSEYDIDLGRAMSSPNDKDDVYYPQFDEKVRREASAMGKHFEIFYCLEKSIRGLIVEKLRDAHGVHWWDSQVPENVRQSASRNMQREEDSGVTVRSDEPIDYTTFGELGEIIKANWATFADTFNSQRR